MATVKVTVTLPEEQLAAIRELVAAGGASSVSAFVQHSVGLALDDLAGWQAMLADALEETGGPLTDEERGWADEVLGPRPAGARDPTAAPADYGHRRLGPRGRDSSRTRARC